MYLLNFSLIKVFSKQKMKHYTVFVKPLMTRIALYHLSLIWQPTNAVYVEIFHSLKFYLSSPLCQGKTGNLSAHQALSKVLPKLVLYKVSLFWILSTAKGNSKSYCKKATVSTSMLRRDKTCVCSLLCPLRLVHGYLTSPIAFTDISL